MKTQTWIPLAAGLFLMAASAGADTHKWKDRIGSNSLSDEPRAANAPGMVTVPPAGVPADSYSVDDSSGNGMAKRDRFDVYSDDERPARRHARGDHMMKHGWATDEETVSTRSAAPNDHYFAYYGEDIPALRGLQLETALNRLHHINMKEIDLAKMAESKAKSADVLNLAHRIRADHEALEVRVKALANRRNIGLEGFQLATFEKAVRDRLSKLNDGSDFEAAFLRVNERGHEEAARSLRMVRNGLSDSETRNLINEALPQMAAHMTMPSDQNKARARANEGDLGE